MTTNHQETAQLGELVAATFDEAAQYSSDPREVARLATQSVSKMLRRARMAWVPSAAPTTYIDAASLADVRRRYLETRVSDEVQRAHRHAEPLALIVFLIDGFKQVNHSQGRATGDSLLRVVTEAIRRTLRPEDVLARLGADEVVVIAPGITAANAAIFGERLRRTIDGLPLAATRPGLHATMSIGVAHMHSTSTASAARLLALAERAANRAKTAGGNRVVRVCTA